MTSLYVPRAAAVKATRLTADIDGFLRSFNAGKSNYPVAVNNGVGIFIAKGDGNAKQIQVGDWVVESAAGVEIYSDANFAANFCPAA
jgi:hypothetical protein